jgi:WD40 repeat protein
LSLDFNPKNPSLLLSSAMDGAVCLYDLVRGELLQKFSSHTKYPSSILFFTKIHSPHDAFFINLDMQLELSGTQMVPNLQVHHTTKVLNFISLLSSFCPLYPYLILPMFTHISLIERMKKGQMNCIHLIGLFLFLETQRLLLLVWY